MIGCNISLTGIRGRPTAAVKLSLDFVLAKILDGGESSRIIRSTHKVLDRTLVLLGFGKIIRKLSTRGVGLIKSCGIVKRTTVVRVLAQNFTGSCAVSL